MGFSFSVVNTCWFLSSQTLLNTLYLDIRQNNTSGDITLCCRVSFFTVLDILDWTLVNKSTGRPTMMIYDHRIKTQLHWKVLESLSQVFWTLVSRVQSPHHADCVRFILAAHKCITDQRERLEETLPLILGFILALIIVITLTVYHFHLKLTATQPVLPRDRSMYKNM